MTRKKTLTKDAALLEALRSNLHLLGEIAMRYEVETQPETPGGPARHQLSPRTFTGCWGRRWRNWPRSSFGCCYWTPRTTSWARGWSTRGTYRRPSSGPPRCCAPP